jgi:hypothetical protein
LIPQLTPPPQRPWVLTFEARKEKRNSRDEWETPHGLFHELDLEFGFDRSGCGLSDTALLPKWHGAQAVVNGQVGVFACGHWRSALVAIDCLQFVAPHLIKTTYIHSSLPAIDRADGNPYYCGEGLASSLVHLCGA